MFTERTEHAETPSLTPRETAVLAWADRARQQHFTLRDIASVIGDSAAAKTAASLVRKGALDRIGHGAYLLRPLRALARPWERSALAYVAALLTGQIYYVGGPAALSLHRITQQLYGSVIDVFITGHRRARVLGSSRVVFHVLPADRFSPGITSLSIEGFDLSVSDPERTVLDLAERPDLLGPNALQEALDTSAARLDLSRLSAYASNWPNLSTCQRLGVLLERAGIPVSALEPLARHVRHAGVAAMIRARPRKGPIHPTWRIILNDVDTPGEASPTTRKRRRSHTPTHR